MRGLRGVSKAARSSDGSHYSVRDYPAVQMHFPCHETSGTDMTDEVHGIICRPSLVPGATITFGNPAYSVWPECDLVTDTPVIGANLPQILAGNFFCSIMVGRSMTSGGFPVGGNGRNSVGVFDSAPYAGPGIAQSFYTGMHFDIKDDVGLTLSVAGDATRRLVQGTDYVLVTTIRPTGQNCTSIAYDLNGNVALSGQTGNPALSQSVLNSGLGTITPINYWRPSGTAIYQWITYQFATEPADLLLAIKYHGGAATQGIKTPYPGWEGRT